MPFAERMSVEGFEFVEGFTKVKRANGTGDAIPTGYTEEVQDRRSAQVRQSLRPRDAVSPGQAV